MKEAHKGELPSRIPRGQLCGRAQACDPGAAPALVPEEGEGVRVRGHPCGEGELRPTRGLPGRVDAPPQILDYLEIVREYNRGRGNLGPLPRFYPGSPRLARLVARPQDRL